MEPRFPQVVIARRSCMMSGTSFLRCLTDAMERQQRVPAMSGGTGWKGLVWEGQ
jgi:hypothetical protein